MPTPRPPDRKGGVIEETEKQSQEGYHSLGGRYQRKPLHPTPGVGDGLGVNSAAAGE